MRCQPHLATPVYIWSKNKQSCLLCGDSTDTPLPVCTPCESELPWLGDQCFTCALPLPMAGLQCRQCASAAPAFERVVAPWVYDFPVDALITRFKHQAKWPLGRLLGQLLAQALQHHFAEGLERPDALVPVPLAAQRLRQRGFNQATLLARWLSGPLGIPCQEHLLRRIQDTPAQQALDAKARRRNLHQAFAMTPKAELRNRHLALVDDVLTTGATANALARLLLDAGAARVDVYCLARTAKPGDPA